MGKQATTVEEQIALLESRGMVFDCEIEKIKESLLDIGYYRLGFYTYYFQDAKSHKFTTEIKFNDIIKLYYFDFDLKMLMLRYIYRIEVHFRTQLLYYSSNHYKDNNTWYVDPKIVDNSILKEFNNIYYILKTKNKSLIKQHDKYPSDFAPAWKVFEFLTFGQIYKLFTNLKNVELKKQISTMYGFRDVSLLDNYLISIINIRNICSHNGVLFDYNQPRGIKRIPNLKYRITNGNTTNLNASLKLLLFMISKVSKNRANDLEQDITNILKDANQNEVVKNLINSKIMFDL
jgi:abortive infection bacteriophage resistance protein